MHLEGVCDMLKRCGLSWTSYRSAHPESDPVFQEKFKKFQEKVTEILPEGISSEDVKIWFQDIILRTKTPAVDGAILLKQLKKERGLIVSRLLKNFSSIEYKSVAIR